MRYKKVMGVLATSGLGLVGNLLLFISNFANIYLDCVNMKTQANRPLQLGFRKLTSTFLDLT